MWGPEGEEVEGESEPLVVVGVGVEHMEIVRARNVAVVVVVVVMVVVRRAESKEGERWLCGDEVYEARRGQNLVKEFAYRSGDHDLPKREIREDLVESVLWKAEDRRGCVHFNSNGDGGAEDQSSDMVKKLETMGGFWGEGQWT